MPDLQLGGCGFESRPGLLHTQPSIPPRSVNEYQLWLGRQRQIWLIPLADETQGVQVKLCYPLTMCSIPEHLRDASCGGAIQIDYIYLYLIFTWPIYRSQQQQQQQTIDSILSLYCSPNHVIPTYMAHCFQIPIQDAVQTFWKPISITASGSA